MASDIRRYGDSGVHTVEGNLAGSRAARLSKQREKEIEEYKKKKQAIAEEHGKAGSLRTFSSYSERAEAEFKRQTVGLVTAEEFRRKRERIAEGKKDEAEKANEERKKKKKKKSKIKKSVLSFEVEDGEENGEDDLQDSVSFKNRKKKDPTVATDFLPDREREEEERKERERLKEEWKKEQARIKVTGTALAIEEKSRYETQLKTRIHMVKKGTTMDKFLEAVRSDLSKEFPELRGVSPDNLLYIKEDLIIPHHYSFYDLIITKARGKSGPLFHFDVHDDIRVINDARVEKDESHPGKIVERHWYEKNKHIFPASRWEVFLYYFGQYDPTVVREKYTIHGHEVNKSN